MSPINMFLVLTELYHTSTGPWNVDASESPINFNHHVSIGGNKCGGSIIDDIWIITSKSCILENGKDPRIFFKKFHRFSHDSSLVITVYEKNIFLHPTLDVALVKVPGNLMADFNLTKIRVYSKKNLGTEDSVSIGFTPGFYLEYGLSFKFLKYALYMLKPYFDKECDDIDYDFQYCSRSSYTKKYDNALCLQSLGSGMVIGSPKNYYLIGVQTSSNCDEETQIYTQVAPLIPWMKEVTGIDFSNYNDTLVQ